MPPCLVRAPLTPPRPPCYTQSTPTPSIPSPRTLRQMPPPRSINIGPYSFSITPGYSDGTRDIGEPEREVLDVARAERVRKRGFKVLEKLRAKSGRRTLSEGELRLLTATIAEFDREVTLERLPDPRGVATERPTRLAAPAGGPEGEKPDLSGGEFDAEVAKLAGLRLAAEEGARGVTLSPEQREAALAALLQDPLIREAARVRVDAAIAERDRMLSELF